MSKKFKNLVPLLAVFLLIVPFLAACGSASGKVNVSLGIFKIDMPATIKAGQVTFHVSNDDTSDTHEFVIFKTDLPEDQLPLTADGAVDEEGAGVTHIDEVEVKPGEASDLAVNLAPGNYVMICNINDNNEQHYMHGMHQAFTVE